MTSLPNPSSSANGTIEGERRRDDAHHRLRVHYPAVIRLLQRAAVTAALDQGRVNADDVRALVAIPGSVSPKVNGAAFRELAEAGILVAVGFRRSARPEAHRRQLTEWQLADRDVATRWMAANPEYRVTEEDGHRD